MDMVIYITENRETISTSKRIDASRRGDPDVLHIVETELREPKDHQVRIQVLATPLCAPDVQARYGLSPFDPKVPFTQGYAFIGNVDAVGPSITQVESANRWLLSWS